MEGLKLHSCDVAAPPADPSELPPGRLDPDEVMDNALRIGLQNAMDPEGDPMRTSAAAALASAAVRVAKQRQAAMTGDEDDVKLALWREGAAGGE